MEQEQERDRSDRLSRRRLFAAGGWAVGSLAAGCATVEAGGDDHVRNRVRRLTESLGIRVPVFQAPFGGSTTPELAAAVANAGGLGGLSVTFRDEAATTAVIKSTQAKTSAPFVVNFVLTHFEPRNVPVALAAGAKLVSFTIGQPTEALVKRVADAGARFMCQVGTLESARRAFDLGAIAVIAQGMEAGGHHEGSTSRRKLLSTIVQAFPDALVVSAGGIGTPEDVLGDLRLGASGVTIGTPFLATPQANVHPLWQEAIIKADEDSTCVTTCFSDGWEQVQRVLRNETLTRWEAAGMPRGDKRPGNGDVVAYGAQGQPLRRYGFSSPSRTVTGQAQEMALYAGKSAASVKSVMDARDVLAAYWNPVGRKLGLQLS